jgi:hypothetical protein
MMTYVAGILLCAVLFMLFGLVRPRTECNGKSCGGCAGLCHRRDESGELHHE